MNLLLAQLVDWLGWLVKVKLVGWVDWLGWSSCWVGLGWVGWVDISRPWKWKVYQQKRAPTVLCIKYARLYAVTLNAGIFTTITQTS